MYRYLLLYLAVGRFNKYSTGRYAYYIQYSLWDPDAVWKVWSRSAKKRPDQQELLVSLSAQKNAGSESCTLSNSPRVGRAMTPPSGASCRCWSAPSDERRLLLREGVRASSLVGSVRLGPRLGVSRGATEGLGSTLPLNSEFKHTNYIEEKEEYL